MFHLSLHELHFMLFALFSLFWITRSVKCMKNESGRTTVKHHNENKQPPWHSRNWLEINIPPAFKSNPNSTFTLNGSLPATYLYAALAWTGCHNLARWQTRLQPKRKDYLLPNRCIRILTACHVSQPKVMMDVSKTEGVVCLTLGKGWL